MLPAPLVSEMARIHNPLNCEKQSYDGDVKGRRSAKPDANNILFSSSFPAEL